MKQKTSSKLNKFRKYLDSLSPMADKYQPWELTVLGGFGGYKSQIKLNVR